MCDDDNEISRKLKEHITKKLDSHKIICWQNQHIKMINKWVQENLLSAKTIGPKSYKGFYTNDKVIFGGNNEDSNVTNATNGVVVSVSPKELIVEWDTGVQRKYTKTIDLSLSYAITAHKAQGSEYKNVIVACYDIDKMKACIDRRWLYTSATRGKEKVVVLATEKIKSFIEMALKPSPITNLSVDII